MVNINDQQPSLWQVIKKTMTNLVLLSVGYYLIRYGVVSKDSFFSFSFLLADLGYFIVLFAQIAIVFIGVKRFGYENPDFSLGKGIKIGTFSSILSKLISFPIVLILGNAVFKNAGPAMNTVGLLSFPVVLITAGIWGAIIGFCSAFFVK